MLFMGWRMPAEGHWYGEIGRLRVAQDYSLELDRVTPLMPLDSQDSISLSTISLGTGGIGAVSHMSTLTWQTPTGGMLHTLNYATLRMTVAIGPATDSPCHMKSALRRHFRATTVLGNCRDGYEMWFSIGTISE